MDPKQALAYAIARAGGAKPLAEALNISRQAVEQWQECPVLRAAAVEGITGVPRHELRPDVFSPPQRQASRRRARGTAEAAA